MILKWINGKNTEKSQFKQIIKYVTNPEKTSSGLMYGLGCEADFAFDDFNSVKYLCHKTGGKLYEHFVVSFYNGEVKLEELSEITEEICAFYAKWQILATVHANTNCLHIHVVINSVSPVSGNKFSQNKYELEKFKEYVKKTLTQYGVAECEFTDQAYEEFESEIDEIISREALDLALSISDMLQIPDEYTPDDEDDYWNTHYEFEEDYDLIMEEYNMINEQMPFILPNETTISPTVNGASSGINIDIGTTFNLYSREKANLEDASAKPEYSPIIHHGLKILPEILNTLHHPCVNGFNINIRVGCTVNCHDMGQEAVNRIAATELTGSNERDDDEYDD